MAYRWVKPHYRKGRNVKGHWRGGFKQRPKDRRYDRISMRMFGKRYHKISDSQQSEVYREVMRGKKR